jgi:SAM-dependent methyltransferase
MPDDLDRALRHRISPQVPVEEFDQNLADTAQPGLLHELNQAALGDQAVPVLLTYSFVTRWDLDQATSMLDLGPGRLLLDLACGQGAPGLWLAERTGCDLVGVDFSEAGLRVARERAVGLLPGLRTRFQRGDLAATGLEDGSVDGAWCGDAYFFAPDLIEALGEVRRVLRPGGRLVMTVCVSLDDQPSAHPWIGVRCSSMWDCSRCARGKPRATGSTRRRCTRRGSPTRRNSAPSFSSGPLTS